MKIIPDKGRCEERTDIVMVFTKEVVQDNIDIFIENPSDHSEVMHIKASEVVKLNPFTFKFVAPEHPPGDMIIKAMVKKMTSSDSGQTARYHCEASAKYQYFCTMAAVDGINHILLYICNALLEVIKGNRIETEQLDRNIAQGLFNYDSCSICTKGFELLFTQYELHDTETSQQDIPTLLHLAAKFGLKELLCKLIDLPGSDFANSIANVSRQQPAEVASSHGHHDMQEMLEHLADMDSFKYEMYVEMKGYGNMTTIPSHIRKYYNSIANTSRSLVQPVDYIDKDDYMLMTGIKKPKPMARSQSDNSATTGDSEAKDDQFYASIDSTQTVARSAGATGAKAAEFFPEDGPTTTPSLTAQLAASSLDPNMDPHQRKLVEMMQRFKENHDLAEAEKEFREWNYSRPVNSANSFQQKERQMKEEKVNVANNKSFFSKLFGGLRQPKVALGATKSYVKKRVDMAENASSPLRDSAASNSSEGSRASTTSVDSGQSSGPDGRASRRISALELSREKFELGEQRVAKPPQVPPRIKPTATRTPQSRAAKPMPTSP